MVDQEEAKGMEDLKYMVIESLDKNGVLDNIRAHLRSSIYNALQSSNLELSTAKLESSKQLDTDEGRATIEIFKDFVGHLGLQHTMAVFLPECKNSNSQEKATLLGKLGLRPEHSKPMVYQLLELFESQKEEEYEDDFEESEPRNSQIDASADSAALDSYDFVEKVNRSS